MLDFLLVLGYIPGTDYQITFNQIIATLGGILLAWLAIKYIRGRHSFKRYISLEYIESKIIKQQV